jgi:UDP:flavonoid glycosyltransferase YjiC (YdhE family)
MHIKKKSNPLPSDIQKFIDESEHGVVYFSLGGNLNPSAMPLEKQEAIIKALSKLKERVLWKWDDVDAKVDKKKFLVQKWFPQDDILANSRVKVFITHGGLLGGTESIYYGKPLITIPIFGDQKLNAARSVASGYGVRVDYSNLTEASLTWALDEVLNSKKYTEKVQELSARFRDKPQHPVDLAKYYVEFVMRHKGAPFMQSSSTHLNVIELNNLDVYAIILAILFIAVFVPYFLLKKLLRSCFRGNDEKTKQKKVKRN